MTATISTIGSEIDHPEAVCWDPRGALVCGTEAGKVLWLDPQSGAVQHELDVGGGFVAGIALDSQGRAYACDLGQGRVARVDPVAGSVETYSSGPADAPFTIPNYPVFDATGRLYVSDSGDFEKKDGRVIMVDPSGTASVGSTEASGFTNGLAISPDGAWLYVVESAGSLISRLPLGDDGSAGSREIVVEMPRTIPDGLAFVDDGRVLISCYRPDTVYVWDGSSLEVVAEDWTALTMAAPTNVAFGGPDLDQLYAANLHNYHVCLIDAGLRGAPLHYPDIA